MLRYEIQTWREFDKNQTLLTIDPCSVSAEKLVNRGNVVNQSEAATNGIGFVEGHGFGSFLTIEERCKSRSDQIT